MNDSELDDQMDEFMITDRSIQESDDSDDSSIDDQDLFKDEDVIEQSDSYFENKIYKEMENFYDNTFSSYELNTIKNIFQEKVWKIYYDEIYDLTYIFIAKINQ